MLTGVRYGAGAWQEAAFLLVVRVSQGHESEYEALYDDGDDADGSADVVMTTQMLLLNSIG